MDYQAIHTTLQSIFSWLITVKSQVSGVLIGISFSTAYSLALTIEKSFDLLA